MRYIFYFLISMLFIYLSKLSINPYYVSSWFVIFGIIAFWVFVDSYMKMNDNFLYSIISGDIMLFMLFLVFINSEMFRAKDYTKIFKVKEINSTDIIVSKPNKIRKVTFAMALNKANKILGENINGILINTQYEISDEDKSIIMYKNKEYWLFPLQYSSFFKWLGNKNIPGYILVDAINPQAKPVFIKKPFKYSPSAFIENNVGRKMWEASGLGLYDYHPEIDENGNLYYIGITYKYKIYGNALIPDKIIILNASNGKIEKIKYEKFLINKKYNWIDKVLPEYMVKKYIKWYGQYQLGFWNTIFEQKNVTTPTDYNNSELWLVENKLDNKLKWFTGMTSINTKDNSLTYGVMIDARKMIIYKIKDLNNITDEAGAISAIESKLGANAIQWEAVLPLPIVVKKDFYWTTSIISKKTNIYQGSAIVKGNNIDKVIIENSLLKIIKKIIGINSNKNIKTKPKNIKEQLKSEMQNLQKDIDNINVKIQKIQNLLNKLN